MCGNKLHFSNKGTTINDLTPTKMYDLASTEIYNITSTKLISMEIIMRLRVGWGFKPLLPIVDYVKRILT